ncbi:MAG: protein-tyrosine-phosphatase [Bacteroidota bacterium]
MSKFCDEVVKEFDEIPEVRQTDLLKLTQYIRSKFDNDEIPKLIVICTHNSRRSHLGQVWLSVAVRYFGLPNIQTFSGGTEATAFNTRAVAALKNVGFEITDTGRGSSNPTYFIKYDQKTPAYQAFSKKYDSSPNPREGFAAIMVCSEADQGCPVVTGADFRIFLPYDDPKAFDETDIESAKYAERCRQIAREMLFVTSKIYA